MKKLERRVKIELRRLIQKQINHYLCAYRGLSIEPIPDSDEEVAEMYDFLDKTKQDLKELYSFAQSHRLRLEFSCDANLWIGDVIRKIKREERDLEKAWINYSNAMKKRDYKKAVYCAKKIKEIL